VIVPALKSEYPNVMGGSRGREEIEVFKRKWICEFGEFLSEVVPGLIVFLSRLLVSLLPTHR
jgi:hypothetical protein